MFVRSDWRERSPLEVSYVQLDDNFATHPKIEELTDREFRVHVRALCYCARHRTNGRLPVSSAIRGMNEKVIARMLDLGLWEFHSGEGLGIHDFAEFNGTALEREQARLRKQAQRNRDKAV